MVETAIEIQARRFPVTIEDKRTGVITTDAIVLDKARLQAAQLVGQSSKELIHRIYNRQGFAVVEIGAPTKHVIALNLAELIQEGR